MSQPNYTYSFLTAQTPEAVFKMLLDIEQWWYGIYSEEITGKSKALNDEFSFKAGEGAHYSKQKLIELVPDKKIVWRVTESNLSFLDDKDEWTDTKLDFAIEKADAKTKVVFTHTGLTPQLECYDDCSAAWTKYMERLHGLLN